MKLFGYGLRQALPIWAALGLPIAGFLLGPVSSTSAGELLGIAGLVDAQGAERARLWSLFGLAGLVLATWRAAELGARIADRDRTWIAPRPAPRFVSAGSLLVGMLLSLAAFCSLAAISVEAQVSGQLGRQLVMAPTGPEILRTASHPDSKKIATWQLDPSIELGPGSRLELLIRPLAGEGRTASLIVRTRLGEDQFDIGSARRISIPLGMTPGLLEFEHGPSGPPLTLFPGESRITRGVPSSRQASLVVALGTWLVLLGSVGLALGFGTLIAPGLAALSSLTVLLMSGAFGSCDVLGAGAWMESFSSLERGWIAPWPPVSVGLWTLGALLFGGALIARSVGAARRGGAL